MVAQPRNGHDVDLTSSMTAASEVGRQICEPAVKAMASSSAEVMALASRRAQAYLEFPARLGTCHSPQDVLAEHARFAQTAWTQYAECATRLMSAYQAFVPQAATMVDIWQSVLSRPAPHLMNGPDRDFPVGGEDGSELEDRRPGPRRAA